MEQLSTARAEFEEVADGVHLAPLPAGKRAGMIYWRIEPGATLPSHSHSNEQLGFVTDGELVAIVEGTEYALEAGDAYMFSSNERHGAENRSADDAIGIGVLAPPREEPDWRRTASAVDRG
ncbi:cupin domain-containing protein [Natrinema salsiterrestre]|uniref:Cupin domain-containing protein n=1 Tax=Natrinema salsiterrestre TaxID=2950540 RepID=A0A9Q4Q299_9EURY|nr:cupin domain-containing protein [Natrinema salsiterrestre]MDF9744617.1 cupin domain-containing protein [Natrinema salsiterrestre]